MSTSDWSMRREEGAGGEERLCWLCPRTREMPRSAEAFHQPQQFHGPAQSLAVPREFSFAKQWRPHSGISRVVLVDFGIEGDCVRTVSPGASQTSVSSCLPSFMCTRPTVPAPRLTLVTFITGTLSWAGWGEAFRVCVCVGGQSPVKLGCLTKVESIYLLLLFQGKSLQSPHWGIIFNPL